MKWLLTFLCCCAVMAFSGRAAAASFIGLGMLPGGIKSSVNAISDDGLFIVGTTHYPSGGANSEAFRWTKASGMEGLGDLPGGHVQSAAHGISADHKVIVGNARTSNSIGSNVTVPAKWTESTGWQSLLPDASSTFANDVSADGSVIVGDYSPGGTEFLAVRWTQTDGMVWLGDLPDGRRSQSANAVTPDGSVIVGSASLNTRGVAEAYRWTEQTGMIGLGDLPGGEFFSSTTDVSADGLVVVGFSWTGDEPRRQSGFRWTQPTGMVRIDPPSNDTGNWSSFDPHGVSGDGSIIVGGPHIWDSVNGTRFLKDVFIHQYGLAQDLAGWTGLSAADISADGRVIVGGGTNPAGVSEAWVAYLDHSTSAPRPPGNYNGDVRVDAADYVVWRKGLGSTHTQADYDAWKANFGNHRTAGVVGTGISSALLSPTNELQSFVAGGVTYTQEDLIQPTLAEFTGSNAEEGHILVPVEEPVPVPGNRGKLLTSDYRVDTGIIDPGPGPTAATLVFSPPLVNGPGPDLVVFQISHRTNTFQLQIGSITGVITETSRGEPISTVDFDLYRRTSGVPSSIVQLENDDFSKTTTVPDFPLVGLAIDLTELGVSPLAEVSTIQFGTLVAHPYFLPVLFMGIRSAPALAGDFNTDGAVDVTDYLVWRNGLGTVYTQADFDVWRAHFGQTAGNGAVQASVPEPDTVILFAMLLAGQLCFVQNRT